MICAKGLFAGDIHSRSNCVDDLVCAHFLSSQLVLPRPQMTYDYRYICYVEEQSMIGVRARVRDLGDVPRQKSGKYFATAVARSLTRTHHRDVEPVNVLIKCIRQELERSAASKSSALCALNDPALDEVSTICARVLTSLAGSEFAQSDIVDPISGLKLPPPPPSLLYKDRKTVPELRRATPEEFIAKTIWVEYRNAGLLASDFIKSGDDSLYMALSNRARYSGRTIVELMRDIGILSRLDLLKPTPEQKHAAQLIKAALALKSAKSSLVTKTANAAVILKSRSGK